MRSLGRGESRIPLWVKLLLSLFCGVLVPAYWVQYGPEHFLWTSDIALILTLAAVWIESRLLASMMAVAVLFLELAWSIDYVARLILGPDSFAFAGTQYMFNSAIPLLVRWLSWFHVVLPVLLVWLVFRLGYDRRALLFQTLLAWVVLPISYFVTEPSANVNWVYGLGREPQSLMPGALYVVLLMVIAPLVLYLPAHFVLASRFGIPRATHHAAR